jgi:hypothetical protein
LPERRCKKLLQQEEILDSLLHHHALASSHQPVAVTSSYFVFDQDLGEGGREGGRTEGRETDQM